MCEAACRTTVMQWLESTGKKAKAKYFVQKIFFEGWVGCMCVTEVAA